MSRERRTVVPDEADAKFTFCAPDAPSYHETLYWQDFWGLSRGPLGTPFSRGPDEAETDCCALEHVKSMALSTVSPMLAAAGYHQYRLRREA